MSRREPLEQCVPRQSLGNEEDRAKYTSKTVGRVKGERRMTRREPLKQCVPRQSLWNEEATIERPVAVLYNEP